MGHNRAMSVSPPMLCFLCLITTVICAAYGDDPFLAEDKVNTLDPADVKIYTTEEEMLERHASGGGLNIPHSYRGVVVANIKATEDFYPEDSNPAARTEQLLDNLRAKAAKMRANTIVGLKFETRPTRVRGEILIVAFGTAID